MSSPLVFFLVGLLFIIMTLISSVLKRMYLTSTILYLLIGIFLSKVINVISLDPIEDASFIRLFAEIAVVISLFTAGLKLKLPLSWRAWKTPLILAVVSMVITIFTIALISHWVLDLPFGASILIGAILAPTDPVLASSVQVAGPEDADKLRFNLTAEAGLNDGTAFPFVMLGLSLLGASNGDSIWLHWIAVDLIWAIGGGFVIGMLLGKGVGKLVVYIRTRHFQTESLDDFLAIGLIGITYGTSVLLHTCGFLAVFVAGLALRRTERKDAMVSGPMTQAALKFNEQLERICELGIVILAGALLSTQYFSWNYLWIAFSLFFIIRPFSVFVPLRSREHSHRVLLSWFGIRGIGLIYYLAFAIEQDVSMEIARAMTGITLSVIVASILLHGLSAAPLMLRHSRRNP